MAATAEMFIFMTERALKRFSLAAQVHLAFVTVPRLNP